MNLSMRATRVAPAAAHALQFTLLVIFVLLPLLVPAWAILSFVYVPTAARGLRNTDSTPGPRWLNRQGTRVMKTEINKGNDQ